MNDLPEEVIVYIFSFCNITDIITKIRFVNKSWYRLCSDKDVWQFRDININSMYDPFDAYKESNRCESVDQIIRLAKYTDFICKLSIYEISQNASLTNIKLLLPYCQRLKKLHLPCIDIDYSMLEIITRNCIFLENLYLYGPLPFIEKYLVLSEIKYLSSLSLIYVPDLSDQDLVIILKRCKNLEMLHIEMGAKISDTSIKQLPSTKISMLNLTFLNGLTPIFWDYIISMPNLEHFYFDGDYNLELNFLQIFIKKCVKLKTYQIVLNNVSLNKHGW